MARDRVGRLADELREPPPRDVPAAEVFGHARLAEAVNEFAEREKQGHGQVAGEAEWIRRRLSESIDDYRDADDDGAGRFWGIGS